MELDFWPDFQTNLDYIYFRHAQKLWSISFFRLYLFSTWGPLPPKTHFRVACVFLPNLHLITPSGSVKSTCVRMKLSALAPVVFSTTQFLLYSLLSRYSWHPSTAMRWGRAGSGQGAVRRGFAGAPSNSPPPSQEWRTRKAAQKEVVALNRVD